MGTPFHCIWDTAVFIGRYRTITERPFGYRIQVEGTVPPVLLGLLSIIFHSGADAPFTRSQARIWHPRKVYQPKSKCFVIEFTEVSTSWATT